MNILIRNFYNDNGFETIVTDGEYIHRIIEVDKTSKLPKSIEIGINLQHSNHYVKPIIVHQGEETNTYVLSYYNGVNSFGEAEEFIYNEEMIEAHNDAVKAGYEPIFGFEDVTTNEKDEIVVINVSKFK